MIEFQLTIYMCSHCTRVHNAAQDCVRHEIEEHSAITNSAAIGESIEDHESSGKSLPFAVAEDMHDVKPTRTTEEPQEETSEFQMQISAINTTERDGSMFEAANLSGSNITNEVRTTRQSGTRNLNKNTTGTIRTVTAKDMKKSAIGENQKDQGMLQVEDQLSTSAAVPVVKNGQFVKSNRHRTLNKVQKTFDKHRRIASEMNGIETKLSTSTDQKTYKYNCNRCDYHTNCLRDYHQHLVTLVHRGLRNVKSPEHIYKYECSKCKYKTDVRNSYTRHNEGKHSKK